MGTLVKWLTAMLSWLAELFSVSMDDVNKDKRGNMPPPEGGSGA